MMSIGCQDCQLEPKHKIEMVGDRMVVLDELSEPSPVRLAYTRKRSQ